MREVFQVIGIDNIFSGEENQSSKNKNNNQQMILHKIEKPLEKIVNNQQAIETNCKIGKILACYTFDKGLIFWIHETL